MKKFRYLYISILTFLFNVMAFAQDGWESADDGWEGGNGATPPPPPEAEGAPATPIDIYEGGLLVLAVLLILGYYFYTKNRKIAHS